MAKLSTIEGIGNTLESKLKRAGVGSTDSLLETCGTKGGRERIARESGIDEARLLRFVNYADLMRIKGVGRQFAEILEAAGVDSVPELAQRNPENLAAKMEETNARKRLVRRVPSATQVADWVKQANRLGRKVTH